MTHQHSVDRSMSWLMFVKRFLDTSCQPNGRLNKGSFNMYTYCLIHYAFPIMELLPSKSFRAFNIGFDMVKQFLTTLPYRSLCMYLKHFWAFLKIFMLLLCSHLAMYIAHVCNATTSPHATFTSNICPTSRKWTQTTWLQAISNASLEIAPCRPRMWHGGFQWD